MTTYSPKNSNDFLSIALNFNGTGIFSEIELNTNTNIDYKINEDNIINGMTLLVKNATFGDYITFQVIDLDGVLTPAGTILSQFGTTWYVASDAQNQLVPVIPYPAKIYAGLYLRLIYTSTTAEGDPAKVAVNYYLHKVLF